MMDDDRQFNEVDRLRWMIVYRLRKLRSEIGSASTVFVIDIDSHHRPSLVPNASAPADLMWRISGMIAGNKF